ncbi:MAG: hypothetical protein H0U49_03715 [Parachlamydiaceae bacterium]|nr:hypothetical protein [Parachlamydiaceae bacterium]
MKYRTASLVAMTSALLFFSCQRSMFVESECLPLVTINIIDQNGVSETISNDDRLNQYTKVDFLAPQPYKKVMRVYRRDEQSNIAAVITSYHPNGQLHQYLELVNGRAYGAYREWYENGLCKINANLIGGVGDLSTGDEQTWIFEGLCRAWDVSGALQAEFVYVKGKLDGTSLYYHQSGKLWKNVPFSNGVLEGRQEVYLEDGGLFQTITFSNGLRNGPATKYWSDCTLAAEETYSCGKLMQALYYDDYGMLVSEISEGSGFRAIFSRNCLTELQEFRGGIQEGSIQLFDDRGRIYKVYNFKNGLKDGEEVEYYPGTSKPLLSIQWVKGKIHGYSRSYYPDGTMESQREMSENKKNGILTAWYADGNMMLIEEYDHNKLVKGEYYKKGDRFPVSTVLDGKGTVTFFDSDGILLKKVSYRNGKPDL